MARIRTNDEPDFPISLDQEWQLRWWSKELGVTPDELRAAVREVGSSSIAVRHHLLQQH